MKRIAVIVVVLAGLAGAYLWNRAQPTGSDVATADEGPMASVSPPGSYSGNAQIGARVYEAKCASCHGENAQGQQGVAPPLIHKIYEPSHHGDEAFQRAVALGVQAHHWPFGNMPPVEGLSRGDVAMIVAYIRETQQANGIQ
ncbi:MAG: cytochrome c [Ruegeria sp.]|uniref:c-type cytochrome n=1 Tax=Ruegeria sp. TaxID=1879320 RepID=UPI00349EFA85